MLIITDYGVDVMNFIFTAEVLDVSTTLLLILKAV